MAVSRMVIANPLQVKAIAHAHVKTDKVDAGMLASLYAAGYLTRRIRHLADARSTRHRPYNIKERDQMLGSIG